jgi:hypothetical protein
VTGERQALNDAPQKLVIVITDDDERTRLSINWWSVVTRQPR